jgi:hypothetical protein
MSADGLTEVTPTYLTINGLDLTADSNTCGDVITYQHKIKALSSILNDYETMSEVFSVTFTANC